MLFEGSDEAAKSFYNVLAQDCDLKGTNLSEFFRRQFVQMMVCGSSLRRGGLSEGERARY